jgi:hypothetical protein
MKSLLIGRIRKAKGFAKGKLNTHFVGILPKKCANTKIDL